MNIVARRCNHSRVVYKMRAKQVRTTTDQNSCGKRHCNADVTQQTVAPSLVLVHFPGMALHRAAKHQWHADC